MAHHKPERDHAAPTSHRGGGGTARSKTGTKRDAPGDHPAGPPDEAEAVRGLALRFTEVPSGRGFYPFIAQCLREVCGAVAVAISTYDAKRRSLVVRTVAADRSLLAHLARLVGRPLVGLRIPLSPEAVSAMFTEVVRTVEDLNGATFGVISPASSRLVQQTLRIGSVTGLALVAKRTLFGSAAIVTRIDQPPVSLELGRALAAVATLAVNAKQAHDARRESEQQLRALFDQSPHAVLLTSPRGSVIRANATACRLFGYSEKELRELGKSVVADDGDRRLAPALEARARSDGFEGELTLRRKDGSRFPAWVTSGIFRDAGGRVRTSIVVRDLSPARRAEDELKSARRRYQSVVESEIVGTLQTTTEGRIIYANETLARMLGYSTTTQLMSTRAESLYRSPAEREALIERLQNTGGISQFELNVISRDGTEKTLLGSATLANGTISKVLIDVTDRARAQAQLEAANERLRRLSRRLLEAQQTERRAIARELHDGIGQIVTMAKINIESTRDLTGDSKVRDHLGEDVEMLDRTLDQIRTLSFGLHPPILEDLGLLPALQWEAKRYEERSVFTPHLVAHDLPSPLPEDVSNCCFMVAREALTNIARHARAKNVWIELREKSGTIEMSIRDDGQGFGEGAGESAEQGSFGVISMQERARLLGGDLSIESVAGSGTTITVSVPLAANRGT